MFSSRDDFDALGELNGVAIAITITGSDQRHLGLLYKDGERDEVMMLHLRYINKH